MSKEKLMIHKLFTEFFLSNSGITQIAIKISPKSKLKPLRILIIGSKLVTGAPTLESSGLKFYFVT